jgi:hypothetical protein
MWHTKHAPILLNGCGPMDCTLTGSHCGYGVDPVSIVGYLVCEHFRPEPVGPSGHDARPLSHRGQVFRCKSHPHQNRPRYQTADENAILIRTQPLPPQRQE